MSWDLIPEERIDALSGRLRSGLGSGAALGHSNKTDSEMAAPAQVGHPHAPVPPGSAEQSANGSEAFDSDPQGNQAPPLT